MPYKSLRLIKTLPLSMNNPILNLNKFKKDVEDWIESSAVTAPVETMQKILKAIEMSIDIIENDRKVLDSQKHFFEGGYYLVRYFEGWGEHFEKQYFAMVEYMKANYYSS